MQTALQTISVCVAVPLAVPWLFLPHTASQAASPPNATSCLHGAQVDDAAAYAVQQLSSQSNSLYPFSLKKVRGQKGCREEVPNAQHPRTRGITDTGHTCKGGGSAKLDCWLAMLPWVMGATLLHCSRSLAPATCSPCAFATLQAGVQHTPRT